MLSTFLVPIHRAGWPFVGLLALVTVGLGLWIESLGWAGAVFTVWCAYFFRDPDRVTPVGETLVVSPADGTIRAIDLASPPPELEMAATVCYRVSIFMNVFNVHVNRIPCDGTVKRLAYRPGKFLNASFDKTSEINERQGICLAMKNGAEIGLVQIAGVIAKRIVCELVQGQPVRAGQRFGMIRFGSRVDLYLPEGLHPLVAVGQRTIAGETVIADFNIPQGRTGESR